MEEDSCGSEFISDKNEYDSNSKNQFSTLEMIKKEWCQMPE